ncbi:MAG: L-lactate permease [Pseudomonadota bacterium]
MPEIQAITSIFAAAPLVIVLFAMAALGWSAASAGLVALCAAAALAIFVFGLSSELVPEPLNMVSGIAAETLHSTATILWIILAALVLFEYQKRSGGIERIRNTLASFTDDRRIEALLIAWFFGLFIEGAAGFGTPVALAAPLLVGVGFPPVRAVSMALVGHAAGVPFGAVGTPTIAQIDISGLDATPLAGTIAAINVVIGMGMLLALMQMADERPIKGSDIFLAVLAAICFMVPYLLLAWFTGPELPALAGAMIGLVVFLIILRIRSAVRSVALRPLIGDLVPYMILVGFILLTRLIEPIKTAFNDFAFQWELFGVFSGNFAPIYHPGTLMMVAIALGSFAYKRSDLFLPSVMAALQRLVSVGIALMLMLALSRTMVHAGMIDALAKTAALAGPVWPFFAPMVGTLGTFVSGSATTSNILFTEFQLSTANTIGLPAAAMVAAQGVGAAIGNLIAPHNIIAGCATVGLVGKEGGIMRHMVPVALTGLLLCGTLVSILN